MTGITNNSGVQPWTSDKIEEAPAQPGIYVLRNLPALNGIIFVQYSDDLKQSLKGLFLNKEIPDVAWFDWYATDSKEFALKTVEDWVVKYAPKYNKG